MVRAYTQEHVYRHPWDRVTTAAWRKFTDPDTPAVLSHILDVHTLSRRLDSATGRLLTTRSITVRSPTLPFLVRRVLGQDAVVCHCVESSVVDAPRRSMDIVARNASLRGLIEVEERSSYRPHPDRPAEWTVFRQETSIRCKPLSALAAVAEKVEQRCADRFLQNSVKGREVVERICKYLEAESSSAAAAASC
ncbi:PRELI domain containing protein 3A [Ananas comosus]|uniref:PRELI domain containing protein 3A n=1 Tax=Ananas comosus TaxID=4615 RepID=A0A199W8J1_ANACO|nr:PRELI domain containing protein 3A [Ananas comosus]XP_020089780.1 PRELI domain containing protein 3A [Ananas comosus]XP_020089781.1 PRELI domain containing protein 3A [Ananas comosus]XP_020089782.1 PRELI domain containing protein 3A [Ananas comosus]OAY85210.1 Protein slowmo [Ananas comosus]